MARYRKKPLVIEAVRVPEDLATATNNPFFEALQALGANHGGNIILPMNDHLLIRTLEGDMRAEPGDWIIKGIKGEFYPCKDVIFRMTYEAVDDAAQG